MTDELRKRRIQRDLDELREDVKRLDPNRRRALEERMSQEEEGTTVLSFRTTADTASRAEALVPLLAKLTGLPAFRLGRADVLRDAVERGLKHLEEMRGDDALNAEQAGAVLNRSAPQITAEQATTILSDRKGAKAK